PALLGRTRTTPAGDGGRVRRAPAGLGRNPTDRGVHRQVRRVLGGRRRRRRVVGGDRCAGQRDRGVLLRARDRGDVLPRVTCPGRRCGGARRSVRAAAGRPRGGGSVGGC